MIDGSTRSMCGRYVEGSRFHVATHVTGDDVCMSCVRAMRKMALIDREDNTIPVASEGSMKYRINKTVRLETGTYAVQVIGPRIYNNFQLIRTTDRASGVPISSWHWASDNNAGGFGSYSRNDAGLCLCLYLEEVDNDATATPQTDPTTEDTTMIDNETTAVETVEVAPVCGRCNGTGNDPITSQTTGEPLKCATCAGTGNGFSFDMEGWTNDPHGNYGGYKFEQTYAWGRVDCRFFSTNNTGNSWLGTVTFEVRNPASSSPIRISITSHYKFDGNKQPEVYAWIKEVLTVGPSYPIDLACGLIQPQAS